MLNFLVRSTLGTWGGAVLDFYLANGSWINGIILFLVLMNYFSRRTYQAIQAALFAECKTMGVDLQKGWAVSSMKKLLDKSVIPWEDFARIGWFPFLAVPGRLLPVRKHPKSLEKLFTIDFLLKCTSEKTDNRK